MTNRQVKALVALSCVLLVPSMASAGTKSKPAPAKDGHAVGVSVNGAKADSLAAGRVKSSDSPLVRAAKIAKAVRTQNAADGRTTAPMNEWMARSLGSLTPTPAISPQSGTLATAGIYDRRASGTSAVQSTTRPVEAIRKDAARAAEQLLEYTPNDDEDEGAAERRMDRLNRELQQATPQKNLPRSQP